MLDPAPSFQAQLIHAIVSLLGTALTLLAGVAIQYVRARYRWISEAMLQDVARSGIALAEEQAAALVKQGLSKLSPDEKMKVAIDWLDRKAPGVSRDEAERIIRAELPKVGLGAVATVQVLADAIKSPEPAGN